MATPASSETIGEFGDNAANDSVIISGSASVAIERRAIGNVRRGTRQPYMGSLSVAMDNSALNARSFSLTGQEMLKPDYSRWRFGVSLGGPLAIPHVRRGSGQFFLGYQMARNRDASTETVLVPTSAMRNGDLSGTLDAFGKPLRIYDPATGEPLRGGQIPVNPEARALLTLYPLPNFEGASGFNYQVPVVGTTRQDDVQFRMNNLLT
ncbi:MAG: TonB-dependent receptor, partial [Bryobacteraceae bacterium]|nr:TonB-dependent receptor [Bryobacteraceae bacterium]